MNLKWISSVKINVPMRLPTCNQQQLGIGLGSEAMMLIVFVRDGYICEVCNQTDLVFIFIGSVLNIPSDSAYVCLPTYAFA